MAKDAEKDVVIEHCEQLIMKIKDIASVKIIKGEDGKISEIRVISNSKRNPKQIIRDIESALIASFGFYIDNDNINIAKINCERKPPSELRLRIDNVVIKEYDSTFEAKVLLRDSEGNSYEGKASVVVSTQGRLKAVAMGTLNAILQYLDDGCAISLEDLITFDIGKHKAVAVIVSKALDGIEEHLIGSALILQDVLEAVVLATLNCINKSMLFSSRRIL